MMRSTGLILTMLCLSSCTTVRTEVVPIGPPVKEYSKSQQVHAAIELKECQDTTIDKCKEVIEMMKDGHVLRQASKEISKK